jgi:hypothetical protein
VVRATRGQSGALAYKQSHYCCRQKKSHVSSLDALTLAIFTPQPHILPTPRWQSRSLAGSEFLRPLLFRMTTHVDALAVRKPAARIKAFHAFVITVTSCFRDRPAKRHRIGKTTVVGIGAT